MIPTQNPKIRENIRRFLFSGLVIFSMLFVIFSISCQQSASISGPTVEISNYAFAPETITISKGDTVSWTNKDSVTHTVTSADTLFDSGRLIAGDTFSFTTNQLGTIEYYCTIHAAMEGKIIVVTQAPTVTPAPTPTPTPNLEPSEAPDSVIRETNGLELSDALIRGCERTRPSGGFANAGLAVGETAVDFTLKDVNGNTVSLAGLLAEKPVVMVFGSFT